MKTVKATAPPALYCLGSINDFVSTRVTLLPMASAGECAADFTYDVGQVTDGQVL